MPRIAASNGVVWWDRWACDNHNSVVLAASGAGKSYLVKVEMLRSLYDGVQVSVIDPEDEYLPLCAEWLCPVEARVEAFGDGSETWCWHCRESCRHHGECAAGCGEHPHRYPYEHGWDDAPFPKEA